MGLGFAVVTPSSCSAISAPHALTAAAVGAAASVDTAYCRREPCVPG